MRVLCNIVGDMELAVQSTIILKHLRANRPDWTLDCQSKADQFSILLKYCVQSLPLPYDKADPEHYAKIMDIQKPDISELYWPGLAKHGIAPTFTNWYLKEKLAYPPVEDLSRYEILVHKYVGEKVKSFLEKLPGKKGAVGIHYQRSNHLLHHETDLVIRELCETLIAKGYNPLTFRWDGKSELVDTKSIVIRKIHPLWAGTRNYGDGMTTAELIRQCKFFIAVDSEGPVHLAASTNTKTVAVWTKKHPVYHLDPSPNVTNMVPRHLKQLVKHQDVNNYYESKHKHIYYKGLRQPMFEAVLSSIE